MTAFLASVMSAEEAGLALEGGADVIDLKDPTSGALGALPVAVIRAAVDRIAGRRPVSATADFTEVRNVAGVEIREDSSISLNLLFDPEHNLEQRIIREQFVP